MHTFVFCVITGIVCFGAGTVYGHTLASMFVKQAKAE